MQSKHRVRPYSKPSLIQFSHNYQEYLCLCKFSIFLSSTLLPHVLSSQLYGHNTNHVRYGVLADSKIEIDHMYV